jgi:hypothetical protein
MDAPIRGVIVRLTIMRAPIRGMIVRRKVMHDPNRGIDGLPTIMHAPFRGAHGPLRVTISSNLALNVFRFFLGQGWVQGNA